MKTINKAVYYCGFCKKKGLVKKLIESHETHCHGNPNNIHPCWECQHLEDLHIHQDHHPTKFHCADKGVYLHSKKFELNAARYSNDLSDSNLMPVKHCDQFLGLTLSEDESPHKSYKGIA